MKKLPQKQSKENVNRQNFSISKTNLKELELALKKRRGISPEKKVSFFDQKVPVHTTKGKERYI